MITTLFAEAAAASVSPIVDLNTNLNQWEVFQRKITPTDVAVQVQITGTASVQIQGRLRAGLAWTVLDTVTANSIKFYPSFPQLRVEIASVDGTVSAAVAH